MSEQARRYNSGKLRYELLPDSLRHVVEVYTKGAHKYSLYQDDDGNVIPGSDIPIEKASRLELIDDGANNWRKGMSWMQTTASLKRHIAAFERGEDYDEDLNTLHLANAAFNILAILEFYESYPELDDRVKKYNKRPVRIGLDIDGVICNFADGFKQMEHVSETHWDIGTGIDKKLKDLKKDFWLDLEPLMDGKDLNFVPCCYVTKRYTCKEEWIIEWLKKNRFPIAPVHITSGKSKVDILRKEKVDIFIDDNYENYYEINKAGIKCFLFDLFHNRKYNVGIDRLNSLNELTELYKITG